MIDFKKINHILVFFLILASFCNCDIGKQAMAEDMQKQKAAYRTKAAFARDIPVQFPDFDLLFLGTGTYTGGGYHVPIVTYYFRLMKANKNTIIFWSAGTGDISPIPFEFNNKNFMIEMGLMAYGRDDEDQNFKEKNKLEENELSISIR